MSEGSLSNRYQAYKRGTTKIVTWLAETARKSQDITAILPSLKIAEDAAKQAKRKHEPVHRTNIEVTTEQLVRLAQVIVEATLPVPDEILQTIRTVIQGREHCAQFYKIVNGDSHQAFLNGTHQHFIKVLKDVSRMLERSKKQTATSKAAPSTKSESVTAIGSEESVSNMFALLQLDQPTANPLGSAPKKSSRTVTFELEVTRDEKRFAIWCLLQDIREVRAEIKTVWADYTRGKITFSNASMHTQTAIVLLQCAEHDFVRDHPDLDNYRAISDYLGIIAGAIEQEVFLCPTGNQTRYSSTEADVNTDDIPELLFPRAFLIMMGFLETLGVKLGSVVNDELYRGKVHLRSHPLGIKLLSLMPLFEGMCRKSPRLWPERDQFLVALHLLADKARTHAPTWTVAAMQIHMDVLDVAGLDYEQEISIWQEMLSSDLARLDALRKMHDERLRLPRKLQVQIENDDTQVKKDLVALSTDPYDILDLKESAAGKSRRRFAMYKAFPSIPGKDIFNSALGLHNRGNLSCDFGQLLLSTAYLYRAALKAGAMSKQWDDMEFVIAVQSEKRPYVLDSDHGVLSMAKCFGIALGLKSQAFRRGQRPALPRGDFVERNSRGMQVAFPWVMMEDDPFYHQTNYDPVQPGYNLQVIKAAFQSLERLRKLGRMSERLSEIYQHYKATGRLTSVQLLIIMEETFEFDEKDLYFDYIGFLDVCFLILAEINIECDPLHIARPDGSEIHSTSYESVYAILWDAADREKSGTSLRDSMLFTAGAAIEQLIGHEGDKYTRLSDKKIEQLRRPPTTSKAIPTGITPADTENQIFMRKFFGMPSAESRGAGMFCGSEEEIEARVDMINTIAEYKEAPETTSIDDVLKAGMRVFNATVKGRPVAERDAIVTRFRGVIGQIVPPKSEREASEETAQQNEQAETSDEEKIID